MRRLLCRPGLSRAPRHRRVRLCRYRPHRSRARPAGHRIRQEHHRWRDQRDYQGARILVRRPRRGLARPAGLRPGQVRDHRPADRRHPGIPALGRAHAARRGDFQHPHRQIPQLHPQRRRARAAAVHPHARAVAARGRRFHRVQRQLLHPGPGPRGADAQARIAAICRAGSGRDPRRICPAQPQSLRSPHRHRRPDRRAHQRGRGLGHRRLQARQRHDHLGQRLALLELGRGQRSRLHRAADPDHPAHPLAPGPVQPGTAHRLERARADRIRGGALLLSPDNRRPPDQHLRPARDILAAARIGDAQVRAARRLPVERHHRFPHQQLRPLRRTDLARHPAPRRHGRRALHV